MFASWIAFKRDTQDFNFIGNKNSSVTEAEKKIVKSPKIKKKEGLVFK
jgi:hypothetical protein